MKDGTSLMVLGITSDIKVKAGAEKDCVQSFTVEWPTSKVNEKIQEAFAKVQSRAKLPGFRPGKAPLELVKESFQGAAYEEAQDLLLREGVAEALKSKKVNPVQPPLVKSVQFAPDKPFQFEFEVEIAPTFKPTNYKGLKINKTVKTVSDAEVQKALDNIVEGNARLVEAKTDAIGPTQFGVIDYTGTLDGAPIAGASAENFLLDMSAPQAIAGLAEGLLGAKVDEERDVKVRFPDDSPAKELAGKEAVFKVKVKAIKEKSRPALDDEFAKDLGLESVDVLKTRVRENLENELKQSGQAEIEKQIVDRLLEENPFSVPPTMVERQMTHLLQRQTERIASQGFPKDQIDKFVERLRPDARTEAERQVRLAYLLDAIAEHEKIEVTDDEVQSRIQAILEKSPASERASMEKALRGSYLERLRSELRETKLFSWLLDNAKVKEVSGGS